MFKIDNINALEKIKQLEDNSLDIIFADPPYALGSEVYIDRSDGKPKYKIAKDFMNKWDMPDHKFWEEFFIEVNRVLKYGGRCILFGIDRQLMLFQYYATMGNLLTNQSLYWCVASSFPKATDVSKMVDKRLGNKREVIGTRNDFALDGANRIGENHKNHKQSTFDSSSHKYGFKANSTWDVEVSKSQSDLGQKYEGYKYSISPMKQNLETIMIFQKETKNKSVLDDLFAFENGDKEISPSIWNIDKGRVPTNDSLNGGATTSNNAVISKEGFDRPWMHDEQKLDEHKEKMKKKVELAESLGRYPSQMFINEEMATILDEQSGILKSGARKSSYIRKGKNPNETYGKFNEIKMDDFEANEGGLSRFFHQIGYLDEELDILHYCSKVSTQERNYGLDDLKDINREPAGNNQGTRVCLNCGKTDNGTNDHNDCNQEWEYKLCKPLKNNHPTLKPIKLIYRLAQLLKTPNEQKIFFPFAGSGSEIIGFILAGFNKDNFEASELSSDYIDIANHRIKEWENIDLELFLNKKKIVKNK